jgi:tryptophan synthase beta chain
MQLGTSFEFGVDENGFFGEFGGTFVPEMLYPNIDELRRRYLSIMESADFRSEYSTLLKDYVGRPSPLFLSENLSRRFGHRIFLKREDLNHTGSHKINNAIGQALIAKRLGRTKIVAETGAGQHGVATATVCALLGIECTIFMGAVDVERQRPNVERIKMLGAKVVAVQSGSKTLKDATNEAMRHWIAHPEDTHYLIGSAVGPHPFPDLVARLQRVIGEEVRDQLSEKIGSEFPDAVIACVGGGSNAMGAFGAFLDEPAVRLFGVEAAGDGVDSGRTAATLAKGAPGVLHGARTFVMQDQDGQIEEAHSISAGLDYPGIGPQHAFLHTTGRVEYLNVTDDEAMKAGLELSRMDGIIPAIETAHAIAALDRLPIPPESTVVVCLSGRGDKDLGTYLEYTERTEVDNV